MSSTLYRRAVRVARSTGIDHQVHRLLGAICGVETSQPIFHLTFDDGPHPAITPRILDVLDLHGAEATFFLLVGQAQRHPDLVRDMLARGHEIGLHSRSHRRLSTVSFRGLTDEIGVARRDLEAVAEKPVRWFRPPYGAQGMRAIPVVRAYGLRTVNWSVDSNDWKGLSREDPLADTVEGIGPGGILLLHDTPVHHGEDEGGNGFIPKDELTDLYLREIERLGIEPVSLARLLEAGPPVRQANLS